MKRRNIVEGHVPAADVKQLLTWKLKAVGLAVQGMRAGSPGMENGDRKKPYEIFLIDEYGRAPASAHYPKT